MKTKIELSVDLKNVPREVAHLLHETAKSLEGISKHCFAISEDLENDALGPILRRVDMLRKKLFYVDSSLEDIARALAAYGEAITQLQQDQQATAAQQAPPQQAGDDV